MGASPQTPGRAQRVQRSVWGLIAAIGVLSASMWLLLPGLRGFGHPAWYTWLAMTALFVLADSTRIHVEIREQKFVLALGELAIVVGLFVLEPRAMLVIRLVAGVIALTRRSSALQKKAFNLALFSLEVAIACAVFGSLSQPTEINPVSWLAAFAAVLAMDIIGNSCVYLVISISQGRSLTREQVFLIFAPHLLITPVNTAFGLVTLMVVTIDARAVIILGVIFLVFVLGYRAYQRVLRQRQSLGKVYGFNQYLERNRGADAALAAAMGEMRDILNARVGLLRLTDTGEPAVLAVWSRSDAAGVDEPVPAASDPIVVEVLSAVGGRRFATKTALPAQRQALESRGAHEVIGVPLGFGNQVRGHLEFWDKQGDESSFADDEIRLLENMSSHLSAAIENQRLVDQLRHDAYHDRLTGLPNRERFVQAVDEAILAAKKSSAAAAVVLLDLNAFKDVNDALGHDYGDDLLIMVGRRLREHVADDGLVARMGADEFAMLCPAADLGEVLAKAQDLREALGRPYILAGLTVEVGVSVGVSVAPEHAHTGGALMQRADVALSHAKGTGRPVSSYLPSMEQATVHRLQLATQLREAIGDGQVQVHYQPKLALASRDLVGVEALVRWQHPEYGAVMPDEFVPLAERTGLIGPLTRHVLKTALTQCRSWLDRDMQIAVAVNLSVKNLLDTAFPESVFALLEEFGVPAGLLTFEITESSVMSDPERSLPVLHRLHERGIGLSIDDFGTGYSSLAYLRRLPVDEVKIDKVFVLGMGTDLGDMAIVRAIVELGRSLTLKVVAEGVEDELARDLLSGMGCDVIQGFLVSRALPAERLDTWLAARTSLGPLQPGVPGRRPQLTG